ncbi:MAG: hypothetical protein HY815_16720, partial [Candidatus Riflebacteria bacterium]|nr:hypothetical protein [Candidatus Riflebacteria bacterium]
SQSGDVTLGTIENQAGDGSVAIDVVTGSATVVGTLSAGGSGNGNVLVGTAAGGISVLAGATVDAGGQGNVLLAAGGTTSDVVIGGPVSSDTGSITILAGRAVTLLAGGTVATASPGTVMITAGGAFGMTASSTLGSSGGNVRVEAATDLTVTGIDAGAGSVSLVAGSGQILDGGDSATDVRGAALRMYAGGSIGTLGAGADGLDLDVTVLSAHALGGGVNVSEASALTIGSVADLVVARVGAGGATTAKTDLAQAGIRTAALGHVIVQTVAGGLTVAGGAGGGIVAGRGGNVLLRAGGGASDLAIGGAVEADAGEVSLVSGGTVTMTAGVVRTTGAGTVLMCAETGVLAISDGARVVTGGGDVLLRARTDLTATGVDAGGGDARLVAETGRIRGVPGSGLTDVTAGGLRLESGGGAISVGQGGASLHIVASTVSAHAVEGGIFLLAPLTTGGLTIGPVAVQVAQVAGDGTTAPVADGSGAVEGLVTENNGSVIVQTTGGGITVQPGAGGEGVVADGAGNVLLSGQGGTSDVTVNGVVRSGSGSITIGAERSVVVGAGEVRTGGSGTVMVTGAGGSVTIAAQAGIRTGGGDVRLSGATSVVVTGVEAGGGTVSLLAGASGIVDGGDAVVDVHAAGLRMVSGGVIDLDTAVGIVSARAGSAGIDLRQTGGLTVGAVSARVNEVQADGTTGVVEDLDQSGVSAALGSVVLDVAGAISIAGDVGATGPGTVLVKAAGSILMGAATSVVTAGGFIHLEATGAVALARLAAGSGEIAVSAGVSPGTTGAITSSLTGAGNNLETTGGATLTARTGIGSAGSGAIRTAVGRLDARNLETGGIFVSQSGDVTLGTIENQAGDGSVAIDVVTGSATVVGAVASPGTGSVRVSVAAGALTLASPGEIRSAGGAIVLAGTTFTQQGTIATGGSGTVDVLATTGAIVMEGAASTVTENGPILYAALTDVLVTRIVTGSTATVSARTGAIVNNHAGANGTLGAGTSNIVATGALLNAHGNTGTQPTGTLFTAVSTLIAQSQIGNIIIQNTIPMASAVAVSANPAATVLVTLPDGTIIVGTVPGGEENGGTGNPALDELNEQFSQDPNFAYNVLNPYKSPVVVAAFDQTGVGSDQVPGPTGTQPQGTGPSTGGAGAGAGPELSPLTAMALQQAVASVLGLGGSPVGSTPSAPWGAQAPSAPSAVPAAFASMFFPNQGGAAGGGSGYGYDTGSGSGGSFSGGWSPSLESQTSYSATAQQALAAQACYLGLGGQAGNQLAADDAYQTYARVCAAQGVQPLDPARFKEVLKSLDRRGVIRVQTVTTPTGAEKTMISTVAGGGTATGQTRPK